MLNPTTEPIDLHGASLLLVDDIPANLDILCSVLEPEGYQLALAGDGPLALKIADRLVPDLVLLDVNMPGMDGFEVCRRLKQQPATQHVPVIFVTANDETQHLVSGFEAGGGDYITKPFRQEEVLMRVRNALYTKYLFDRNQAYQHKMEEELQTAHELQLGLMPTEQPQVPGFAIAGRCRSAAQVGGDFFQYFEPSQGGLSLALGDVTGHAMSAAIPMILVMGMLHSQMEQAAALHPLFPTLNRSVHQTLDKRTFACFAAADLDPTTSSVTLTNAGYPYPYHFRVADQQVVELAMHDAYPLGARLDSAYQSRRADLAPGDRLVFCSDGIFEAENEEGEMMDQERLVEAVEKGCRTDLSAPQLVDHLLAYAREYSGAKPQHDDQTVVVVRAGEE
ncbi:MAG: SpoIIE family protein phosphatase [Candidatus Latescibacteria bacterium]|nr:SpoIIE family protein phosphatase [Candidatus Latescibacterota bacterium]